MASESERKGDKTVQLWASFMTGTWRTILSPREVVMIVKEDFSAFWSNLPQVSLSGTQSSCSWKGGQQEFLWPAVTSGFFPDAELTSSSPSRILFHWCTETRLEWATYRRNWYKDLCFLDRSGSNTEVHDFRRTQPPKGYLHPDWQSVLHSPRKCSSAFFPFDYPEGTAKFQPREMAVLMLTSDRTQTARPQGNNAWGLPVAA